MFWLLEVKINKNEMQHYINIKELFTITDRDVRLLEEVIKYIPRYANNYYLLSENEKKIVIKNFVYGFLQPNWRYRRLQEKKGGNATSSEVSGILLKVKEFFMFLHRFILRGVNADHQNAKNKLEKILATVTKEVRRETDPQLKSLDSKKELLTRYFNAVYTNLMTNLNNAIETEKHKKRNFIARKIYEFINSVLMAYGHETVTDEYGRTKLEYSSTLKRIQGLGILVGIVIGVGALLLFLLTKIPIIGRLFGFFLRILTAPLRILWNGLGFILRKLRVI